MDNTKYKNEVKFKQATFWWFFLNTLKPNIVCRELKKSTIKATKFKNIL